MQMWNRLKKAVFVLHLQERCCDRVFPLRKVGMSCQQNALYAERFNGRLVNLQARDSRSPFPGATSFSYEIPEGSWDAATYPQPHADPRTGYGSYRATISQRLLPGLHLLSAPSRESCNKYRHWWSLHSHLQLFVCSDKEEDCERQRGAQTRGLTSFLR